jgi:hypothetical protein
MIRTLAIAAAVFAFVSVPAADAEGKPWVALAIGGNACETMDQFAQPMKAAGLPPAHSPQQVMDYLRSIGAAPEIHIDHLPWDLENARVVWSDKGNKVARIFFSDMSFCRTSVQQFIANGTVAAPVLPANKAPPKTWVVTDIDRTTCITMDEFGKSKMGYGLPPTYQPEDFMDWLRMVHLEPHLDRSNLSDGLETVYWDDAGQHGFRMFFTSLARCLDVMKSAQTHPSRLLLNLRGSSSICVVALAVSRAAEDHLS